MEISSLLNKSEEEDVNRQVNSWTRPNSTHLPIRNAPTSHRPPQSRRTEQSRRHSVSQPIQTLSRASSFHEKREGRPAYPREHEAFIWYQKDDLDLEWNVVAARYRTQFGVTRNKGGLQCKYYRIREGCGAPPVRRSRKGRRDPHEDPVHYGVVRCSEMRYSWMLPHHQRYPAPPPRPQVRGLNGLS